MNGSPSMRSALRIAPRARTLVCDGVGTFSSSAARMPNVAFKGGLHCYPIAAEVLALGLHHAGLKHVLRCD
jgi:hypothetical protein